MRDARNAGVLRVAEDRGAKFHGPALSLEFAHADEGMLLRSGVALVVEVVKQAGGGVELNEAGALVAVEAERSASASPQAVTQISTAMACLRRLSLWVHSVSNCQACSRPNFLSPFSIKVISEFYVLHTLVRVSSGCLGFYARFFGLTLSFYLTIMVHSAESSTYRGAKHPGSTCSGTPRNSNMATTLISVDTREVVRCDFCSLVQYRTTNSLCRKCRRPLDIEEPAPLAPQLVTMPPVAASAEAGLQVAAQVREIRRARHLSQRQLASRMQVPRTYISKIENGKAIPTLGSLERLAYALEVDMRQLVRDSRSRRDEEVSAILSDPFLAEIAAMLPHLDSLHRTLLYGSVRDMAAGRRRTA